MNLHSKKMSNNKSLNIYLWQTFHRLQYDIIQILTEHLYKLNQHKTSYKSQTSKLFDKSVDGGNFSRINLTDVKLEASVISFIN